MFGPFPETNVLPRNDHAKQSLVQLTYHGLGTVPHSHMAPQLEPVNSQPSKRWTQFYAALQLAIQRAAHKWTSVFTLLLSSRSSHDCLVSKTFPSVSLYGVRNSQTAQRASSTPSQALSKPTSSYVFSLPSHISIPAKLKFPNLPYRRPPSTRRAPTCLHSSVLGW
jgi:hypothetical protein